MCPSTTSRPRTNLCLQLRQHMATFMPHDSQLVATFTSWEKKINKLSACQNHQSDSSFDNILDPPQHLITYLKCRMDSLVQLGQRPKISNSSKSFNKNKNQGSTYPWLQTGSRSCFWGSGDRDRLAGYWVNKQEKLLESHARHRGQSGSGCMWLCDLNTAADYRWMACRCDWLVGNTWTERWGHGKVLRSWSERQCQFWQSL